MSRERSTFTVCHSRFYLQSYEPHRLFAGIPEFMDKMQVCLRGLLGSGVGIFVNIEWLVEGLNSTHCR